MFYMCRQDAAPALSVHLSGVRVAYWWESVARLEEPEHCACVSPWFKSIHGSKRRIMHEPSQQSSWTRWPWRTRLHLEDTEISLVIHGRQSFTLHTSFFPPIWSSCSICLTKHLHICLHQGEGFLYPHTVGYLPNNNYPTCIWAKTGHTPGWALCEHLGVPLRTLLSTPGFEPRTISSQPPTDWLIPPQTQRIIISILLHCSFQQAADKE